MISLDKRKVLLFFFFIIFKFSYLFSVDLLQTDQWGGNVWKNINWEYLYVELAIFFLFFAFFYCWVNADTFFMRIYLLLSFVFFLIPCNSMLVLADCSRIFYVFSHIYIFLFLLCVCIVDKFQIGAKLHCVDNYVDSNISHVYIKNLTYCVVVFLVGYVAFYGRFSLDILDWSNMYNYRAEFADMAASRNGTIFSYISILLFEPVRILLSFCFYYSLKDRSLSRILLCCISYVSIFMLAMDKAYIFPVVVVIALWIVDELGFNNCERIVCCGTILLMVMSLLEFFLYGTESIFSVIISRIFYLTWHMTEIWFEFWTEHENMWFRTDCICLQSIFSSIGVNSPYGGDATQVVSKYIYNFLIPVPNSGFISEAIAQMGVVSLCIFPFLHACYVKMCDLSVKRVGTICRVMFAIFSIMTLQSVMILNTKYVLEIVVMFLLLYASSGILRQWDNGEMEREK